MMKQIIWWLLPKSSSEQFNPNEMTMVLLSKLKGAIFQDQFNLVVPHLKHNPFRESVWYKNNSYNTSSINNGLTIRFNINLSWQTIEIELFNDQDNYFVARYNQDDGNLYCRQTKTEELTVGVNV